MLPSNLEHLCSLNANCPRQVIAFDYDLNTSEFHISKKNIRVNENLSFKEANKRKHIFFETDRHLSANEIVEIYMVLINKSIASLFKLHLITDRNTPSSPIYRITDDYFSNELSNHIDNTAIAGSYAVVRETNYLHITSPIRRWVDVLNSIHLQTLMEIHSFREDAYNAIQIFKENIVERNNDYHNIQKITSNCRILYAIDNNIIKSDAVYDGVLLEDARHVYIPLLKYVGKCPENMDYSVDAYRFKIVYFCDEYSLKKKIRLQQQLN
jgi:hypothetical protein